MLFQVKMTVTIPAHLASGEFDSLKKLEKARAQELQIAGVWRHLWRIVGNYANISVFEVTNGEELHEILSTLPLFPYMNLEVTPLCRHPSSIEARG
ncbi:MAG: muconolactone Delta-isomerase [Afipia sp.]|jgi:muconolactone D-isomerase|uniref:Muconolactone Delta-isomerase n=1 Tax=Candidatus Afipia apatlaquensis TaxID=2712852 RepID=A0A7C9VL41_9BRAD|nr:muconolactone Delta-isomerase [Afipia sp.]NGX97610.1 muconolactone Delta-isomerase [Candidatus Afipia apatlaquensis]RTL76004.1 MAG: muconolactone Delta-isomerase [Bradyrhizobiaceae bacterium]